MNKTCYTYILASKRRGALFIGMTSDLSDCIGEHKHNQVEGLTSLYAIHQLVYLEKFENSGPALLRQSELKKLPRFARLDLIEQHNPDWHDLYDAVARAEEQAQSENELQPDDELQLVNI